jgi:hypothetical protein
MSTHSTHPGAHSAKPFDAVQAFQCGIKCDSSAFMVIKDMKQLEEYYLSLKIQSPAQGVSEPLDPTYVPSTNEEKQLFCLKQDFLFGVFAAMMKVSCYVLL